MAKVAGMALATYVVLSVLMIPVVLTLMVWGIADMRWALTVAINAAMVGALVWAVA